MGGLIITAKAVFSEWVSLDEDYKHKNLWRRQKKEPSSGQILFISDGLNRQSKP